MVKHVGNYHSVFDQTEVRVHVVFTPSAMPHVKVDEQRNTRNVKNGEVSSQIQNGRFRMDSGLLVGAGDHMEQA